MDFHAAIMWTTDDDASECEKKIIIGSNDVELKKNWTEYRGKKWKGNGSKRTWCDQRCADALRKVNGKQVQATITHKKTHKIKSLHLRSLLTSLSWWYKLSFITSSQVTANGSRRHVKGANQIGLTWLWEIVPSKLDKESGVLCCKC